MKQFLKMTLAVIVGVIIAGVIFLSLFVAVIEGVAKSSESTTIIAEKHSVYKLTLEGVLQERGEETFQSLLGSVNGSISAIGLDDVIKSIKYAANQPNIDGIYLNLGTFAASPASVQEIRGELEAFKASGKFIIAYGDNFTNGTYYLASVADKVYMNPEGMCSLNGLTLNTMFYTGLMEKVGVEMQIFKVGTFKSAVEPYIRKDMSEENKLQLHTYADGVWERMCTDMAAARNISVEAINEFSNSGDFFGPAEKAVECGLVDSLIYRHNMIDILAAKTVKDFSFYTLSEMVKVDHQEKVVKNKIAVLYATGAIDGGGEGEMDSEKIARELHKLADDKKIKAVVLRINSGGGSAFGSEQMWNAAMAVKAQKPLIVSMGDYAASGGYYMGCCADVIVAQPNTLTGSIGIFGMMPNVEGATKKIGVTFDGIKTNEYADLGAAYRPMNEGEKAIMQNMVNRGYELFVKRCADGRGMTTDEIKAIAEGRVWSGTDALEIGLVDELGDLDRAIEIAAEKADIAAYNVKEYPAKRTLTEELMEAFYGSDDKVIKVALGDEYNTYKAIKQLKNMQGVMALNPYYISF